MKEIRTPEDITTLSETVDLECKLAAGKHGKGQLPTDFWPTYSAFANTHGGVVLLGVKEKQGHFSLHGIQDPQRVITTLFNHLNNPQKVSENLLTETDVKVLVIDGCNLIQVTIPPAHRKQKPVYLGGITVFYKVMAWMMSIPTERRRRSNLGWDFDVWQMGRYSGCGASLLC